MSTEDLLQLDSGEPDKVSPRTPSLYSTITVYQPPVQESPFEGRRINTEMLTKAGKRAYSREVFNMYTDEVDRLFGTTLQENPQLREERVQLFKLIGISEGDYPFFTRSLHMRRQNYHAARENGITNLEIPVHHDFDASDAATRVPADALKVQEMWLVIRGHIVEDKIGLLERQARLPQEIEDEVMVIQGQLVNKNRNRPAEIDQEPILRFKGLLQGVDVIEKTEGKRKRKSENDAVEIPRTRFSRIKKVAAVAAVTIGILGAIGTYAAYQHPIGRAVLNNLGNLLNGDTAANTIINMALNGDQGQVTVDINFAELDLGGVAVSATNATSSSEGGDKVFISDVDPDIDDKALAVSPTKTPVPTSSAPAVTAQPPTPVPASVTPTVTEQPPTNTDVPPTVEASATTEPTLEEPTDEPTEELTLQLPTETPTEKEPEIVPTTPPDPETQAMLDILEKNRDPNKFSKILIIGDTGSQFGQYVDEMQLNGGGIQSVFKFNTRDYRYYDLRANVDAILQNEGITGGNMPAFAVITLGANDTNWVMVTGSMNEGTDSEFRAYVEDSVRGFMAQGIVPILMGIPADTSLGSKWSNGAQLNPIIRGVAQSNRIPYLDPPQILGQVGDVIVDAITSRTNKINSALDTPEIVPTTVASTATTVPQTQDPTATTVVATNTTVPSATATVATATTQAPTQVVASATKTPTQVITKTTEPTKENTATYILSATPTHTSTLEPTSTLVQPTFTPTNTEILPTQTEVLPTPEPTITPEGEQIFEEEAMSVYNTMYNHLIPVIGVYRNYLLENKQIEFDKGKFETEQDYNAYMDALDKVEASIKDGKIFFVIGITDRDGSSGTRAYIEEHQEHLGNMDGLFFIHANRDRTDMISMGRNSRIRLPYPDVNGGMVLGGKAQEILNLGNPPDFPIIQEFYKMGTQTGDEGSIYSPFALIDPWTQKVTGEDPDFSMQVSLGIMQDFFKTIIPNGITLQFPQAYEFPHGDGSVTRYIPDANGNVDLTPNQFFYLTRVRGDNSFRRGEFFLDILRYGNNAATLGEIFLSMPKDQVNNLLITALLIGGREKDANGQEIEQDRSVVFRGGDQANVWRDLLIIALSNKNEDSNFGLSLLFSMFGGYFSENQYVSLAQQAGLLPNFTPFNVTMIPGQFSTMEEYSQYFQLQFNNQN